MAFIDIARKRYSVRSYLGTEVEPDKILSVLEAARMAPSACNLQPVKFVVITDPEVKNIITTQVYQGKWLKSAPVIIAVCGDHNNSWKRWDGKDHCDIDTAIAIDHLTLAAADLGLGTCWICSFDSKLCHRILNMPENYEVVALIPLGYTAEDGIRETNRKNIDDLVCWQKFING
ncbi:MAG: nfrA2 [Herbinix sp.]|jgi:nitroreductase|nr:nfrA2 [Herbinix sp.]